MNKDKIIYIYIYIQRETERERERERDPHKIYAHYNTDLNNKYFLERYKHKNDLHFLC